MRRVESIRGWRELEDGRALDECIGRGGKRGQEGCRGGVRARVGRGCEEGGD